MGDHAGIAMQDLTMQGFIHAAFGHAETSAGVGPSIDHTEGLAVQGLAMVSSLLALGLLVCPEAFLIWLEAIGALLSALLPRNRHPPPSPLMLPITPSETSRLEAQCNRVTPHPPPSLQYTPTERVHDLSGSLDLTVRQPWPLTQLGVQDLHGLQLSWASRTSYSAQRRGSGGSQCVV